MNIIITKLLGGLTTYALPIIGGVCFVSGLYVSHVWHGYQETKHLQAIQENVIQQQKINNKIVSDLQDINVGITDNYNKVKDQLHVTTLLTPKCKLTPAAISLWNSSIGLKETVPTDTSGTSSDTPSVGGIEITLEQAFGDKAKEDEQYNLARERAIKLNEWEIKTFGQ